MTSAFTIPVLSVDPGEFSAPVPVLTAELSTGIETFSDTAALCAAVRRGEEAAVRALHARHSPRLMRYALVIARGDETAAAEAVQNAFLKAIRSLRPLADEDALWAWLARACRSAAADESRRRRRYSAILDKFTALFSSPPAEAPEDTDAIWHDALVRATAALDDSGRALLDARYTQCTPLVEIAALHATTERAIEGRLARLREKLRQSILRQLSERHEC